MRLEQPLGDEDWDRRDNLPNNKEYLARMGHYHSGSQEYLRVPPSGREQTQEQIHLSTQDQSVSFVSRPSPLLLLPDKVTYQHDIEYFDPSHSQP